MNITIIVDNNIVKNSQGNIVVNKDGIINKYNCNIIAGDILLKEEDYNKLVQSKYDSIYFTFSYSDTCDENTNYYNYEIEDFKQSWLNPEQQYVVIYIYNTDNKNYTKIYNPLPGKSYTYEYDAPGGSMRRVQKNLTKEQKKCQSKKVE